MEELDLKDLIVDSPSAKDTKVVPTSDAQEKPIANKKGVIKLSQKDLGSSDATTEEPQQELSAETTEDSNELDLSDLLRPELDGTYDTSTKEYYVEGLDTEAYKSTLGEDIFSNPHTNQLESLNNARALSQTGWQQFAGFVNQAVVGEILGGTIEGLGYLLDWESFGKVMTGQEDDFNNWLSDIGQGIREYTQEATPIYENPLMGEGFFNKMGDFGWWMSNGVSVASTLSMLLPTTAAVRGLSYAAKLVAGAKNLGKVSKTAKALVNGSSKTKWMAKGVTQAVLSRNIENFMEAHGTYEESLEAYKDTMNPETGELFTEDEAKQLASKAAANNWKAGWAMLLQDIPQYLALGRVFNPVTKKMEGAISQVTSKGIMAGMKPWQKKVAGGLGVFAGEGAEEGYQYMASKMAKLSIDAEVGLISDKEYWEQSKKYFGDEEFMTSAFFGGLGGNVFQGAGKLLNYALKGKSGRELENNYGKNLEEVAKRNAAKMQVYYNLLSDPNQRLSPEEIKGIHKKMFLGAIVDQVEADNFDSFIANIESVSEMNSDEVEALADQEITFDPKSAKENAEAIIELAKEVREEYLVHRDKFDDPTIAKQVTLKNALISINNDSLVEREKAFVEMMTKANFSSNERYAFEESKIRLDQAVEALKELKKEQKKSKTSKKSLLGTSVESAIETANENINSLREKHNAAKKEYNDYLKGSDLDSNDQQKKLTVNDRALSDKQDTLRFTTSNLSDLANTTVREIYDLDNANNQMFNELYQLKDENRQAEVKEMAEASRIENMISNYTSLEDVPEARKSIERSNLIDDNKKEKYLKELDKKEAQLKAEEAINNKKVDQAVVKTEQDNDSKEKLADPASEQPASPVVTKGKETFEDHSAFEEIDVNENIQDSQSELDKAKEASQKNVALLDNVAKAKKYKEWTENGKKKVGTKMTIIPSTAVRNARYKDIVERFKALKPNEPTPQEFYDYLPLQVYVTEAGLDKNGKPLIYTFLPDKNSVGKNEYTDKVWAETTYPQRVIAIERMRAGLSNETVIVHSAGGAINNPQSEDGSYTNTLLSDLKQVQESEEGINGITLLVTNEDGRLMDTNKNLSEEFEHIFVQGSNAKDGSPRAMGGAVFIVLNKADGTRMPVKLNLGLMEKTDPKLDMLARLLGQNVKFTADLYDEQESGFDQDTVDSIEKVFSQEIEILSEMNKDISLMSIIDMFFMVGNDTKGLMSQLYFSKDGVVFGPENLIFGQGSNFSEESLNQLKEYLSSVKRRQFNIKYWNESPAYRKYAVETGLLTSDILGGQPEFISDPDNDRRIQNWVAPLTAPESNKERRTSQQKIITAKVPEETEETEATEDSSAETKMYDETGVQTVISLDMLKKSKNVKKDDNTKPEILKGSKKTEKPEVKKVQANTKEKAEDVTKKKRRRVTGQINSVVDIDKKTEKNCKK